MKITCAVLTLVLSACASSAGERFYTLTAAPRNVAIGHDRNKIVALRVTIPVVVDRPELVVHSSPTNVAVLENERWAGALSEQIAAVLSLDLEDARPDLAVIGSKSSGLGSKSAIPIAVEVRRLDVDQVRGVVTLEGRWVVPTADGSPGPVQTMRTDTAMTGTGYDGIPVAISQALAQLAQALGASLPS